MTIEVLSLHAINQTRTKLIKTSVLNTKHNDLLKTMALKKSALKQNND